MRQAGSSRSAAPGSLSSGLAALAQPLKLRLARSLHERALRDYASNVVLIEPLATLAAVEEFLHPRIKRSEPASSPPPGTDATPGEQPTTATEAVQVPPQLPQSGLGAGQTEAADHGLEGARASMAQHGEGRDSDVGALGGAGGCGPTAVTRPAPIPEGRSAQSQRMTRAAAARAAAQLEQEASGRLDLESGLPQWRGQSRGPAVASDAKEDEDIIMLQVRTCLWGCLPMRPRAALPYIRHI